MYERILAAIDDSDIGGRVLAAAQELAILSGGEVWAEARRTRSSTWPTGRWW